MVFQKYKHEQAGVSLAVCSPCSLDQLDTECNLKWSPQCFYKPEEKLIAHQPTIYTFCWGSVILRDTAGELHQFGVLRESSEKDPNVKDHNWHPHIMVNNIPQKTGDVFIWNNGFEHWPWAEDGTRHDPGISRKALEKALKHAKKLDVIILTQGVQGVLKTSNPDLMSYINELKCEHPYLEEFEFKMGQDVKEYLNKTYSDSQLHVIKLKSFDAVILYNALVMQGKSVVMLLHTTC